MKLTTILSALTLAGMLASGAMAQAPREVTAPGRSETQFEATQASVGYSIRLTGSMDRSQLQANLENAFQSSNEALPSDIQIEPQVDYQSTTWVDRMFIDWGDLDRSSTLFSLITRGSREQLQTMTDALDSMGERISTNYSNHVPPDDIALMDEAVLRAETDSQANASLIARAFGCTLGALKAVYQLPSLRPEYGRQRRYLVSNYVIHNGGSESLEATMTVTLTATYETVCPAEG